MDYWRWITLFIKLKGRNMKFRVMVGDALSTSTTLVILSCAQCFFSECNFKFHILFSLDHIQ